MMRVARRRRPTLRLTWPPAILRERSPLTGERKQVTAASAARVAAVRARRSTLSAVGDRLPVAGPSSRAGPVDFVTTR
jgi:hypothetical protein